MISRLLIWLDDCTLVNLLRLAVAGSLYLAAMAVERLYLSIKKQPYVK